MISRAKKATSPKPITHGPGGAILSNITIAINAIIYKSTVGYNSLSSIIKLG